MANTNPLVNKINERLNRLTLKANELQGLSQRNQQVLVDPQGELMRALSSIKQRISGLAEDIQKITDGKKQLEGLIRDTDANLGALEQRLTETISQIDVQPLLEQLKPLSDDLDRIATLINLSNAPSVPPGGPGQQQGPQEGQLGGYVIPKHKKRTHSSKKRTHSSKKRIRKHKSGGGKTYKKIESSKLKIRKTKRKTNY